MKLRILLPHNGRVCSKVVPAKIELEDSNGNRFPPEKVDVSLLGNLPDAERGVGLHFLSGVTVHSLLFSS